MTICSRTIAIALLSNLLSCTSKEQKVVAPAAMVSQATTDIVWSIIRGDSLTLSSQHVLVRPIYPTLQAIQFIFPSTTKYPPPTPQGFSVSLRRLLYHKYHQQPFFSQQDSVFLLHQSQQQRAAVLDTSLFVPGDLVPVQRQAAESRSDKPEDFYRFSLPLFSKDSLRAYIQLDHICTGCGGGSAYFLEKKEGEWKVVDWDRTWFN